MTRAGSIPLRAIADAIYRIVCEDWCAVKFEVGWRRIHQEYTMVVYRAVDEGVLPKMVNELVPSPDGWSSSPVADACWSHRRVGGSGDPCRRNMGRGRSR